MIYLVLNYLRINKKNIFNKLKWVIVLFLVYIVGDFDINIGICKIKYNVIYKEDM